MTTLIRRNSYFKLLLVAVLAILPLGCGGGDDSGPQPPASDEIPATPASDDTATVPDDLPPPPPAIVDTPAPVETPETPSEPEDVATSDPEPTPSEPDDNSVVTEAAPGMGAAAQDLGMGPIVTPINALFRTKERIMLMQIENNMKMFKVYNNRYPKSFEEFEKEILKPSQLTLPKLPHGHEYQYDAETGQLMVKQPR